MIILNSILSLKKEKKHVFFPELYTIALPTGTLYYTSGGKSIDWYIPGTTTPVTYAYVPIQREEVKEEVDGTKDKVTLRISNTTESFTDALLQSYDIRGNEVNIYQIAYPDSLGNPDAYNWLYSGVIDAPSLDMGKATFEVTLSKKLPNLESERTVQIGCNAWFGDYDECGAYKNTGGGITLSNSTSTVIYCTGFGNSSNFWVHGIIKIGYETRQIIAEGQNYVQVDIPFVEDTAGKSFYIEQGCNHTTSDCSKYNNLINYGGFPAVSLEYGIKYS